MNERIDFDQALSVDQAEMKATSVPAFHEHLVWAGQCLWSVEGQSWLSPEFVKRGNIREAFERGGIWVRVSGWRWNLISEIGVGKKGSSPRKSMCPRLSALASLVAWIRHSCPEVRRANIEVADPDKALPVK